MRQINLLNVNQCTEVPSIIQHAKVKARVHDRAKANCVEVFKHEAYTKEEQKVYFQAYIYYILLKYTCSHPMYKLYTTPFSVTSFFLLSYFIPIEVTYTDTYLPLDDPNITNLNVSHYDCGKQQNWRQLNLLNVKQCTEIPSNIQNAKVKARVYVQDETKRVKAFK